MNTTDEKERMRRAVWGLYSETRGLHPAVLPSDVRPIRVERALDILLEHKDENRGSRRRRAVLEAGAANLHQHSRPGIADRVRQLAKDLKVPDDILTDVGTPRADAAADKLLALATGKQIDCVAVKTLDIKVEYDPRTHDSTLTVVTRVNRPIQQMEPFVDPRNWKECSDFFETSDPVDPHTLEPIEVKNPRVPWQLHEVFNLPTATFENLLNITFLVDLPRHISVTYSLYESCKFTLVGLELPGVLERDSGFVCVVPDLQHPGETLMTTKKTVRFRDLTPDYPIEGGIDQGQWLNYCAPAMLGLWIDDISQGRLCCKHL